MRTIETITQPIATIAKFDLAFSSVCLQHRFNQQVANISKGVSHSGDGHLYVVLGLLAWYLDKEHGSWFMLAGLLAFTVELPIYWTLKNSFKRRRPEELSALLPAFITLLIATVYRLDILLLRLSWQHLSTITTQNSVMPHSLGRA